MDYEKKYKEALSRARQFSEHPLLEDSSNIVEYIFPELCESEDEKIRKEIISALQYANHKGVYDKHLAWLEKQGESKFEQCTQEGDKIVTNEDGTHFNVSQLERVAKKEPKKVEDKPLVIDEGKAEMDYCFTKMMNGEKINPAWSEEDEENLNQLHKLIVKKAYCEYEIDTDDETLYGKWLKLDNWLKSLKPQPQWKPSEEQIQALEYQVNSTYIGSWQYKASKELLEQLKKL